MCPLKRNDVDRKWSNDVLTTFKMMLCPYGHKHKKRPFHKNSRFFDAPYGIRAPQEYFLASLRAPMRTQGLLLL